MRGARLSARRGDSIGGCKGGSGAATRPGERRNVGGTITHSWGREWQGGAAKLACPASPRAATLQEKLREKYFCLFYEVITIHSVDDYVELELFPFSLLTFSE